MHQTRESVSKKVPILRKGTKYVARPSSHLKNSVSTVIAVRDMLKLANTTKEVKAMIRKKLLKINNKPIKDHHASIKIFNVLEADKKYALTLLPSKKYSLQEVKSSDRACKVTDKKLLKGKKVQLNLHDGSNIVTSKDIKTGDTIHLDEKSKIKSHSPLKKGAKAFIISGKYTGQDCIVESKENSSVKVKIKDKERTLPLKSIFVR